jgi:hypothetical protein
MLLWQGHKDMTQAQRTNITRLRATFEMRVRQMIRWEAQRAARAEVVHKLKAEGVKVALLGASTITRLALDYMRAHQGELLAKAEASGAVQRLRAEADLSNIETSAQIAEA